MNSTPSRTRRSTAVVAAAALCAAGLVATVPAAAPAQAAPTPVVITPNPAVPGPEFQGWGTSLVWFANATGDYPEEIREELYQLLFGEEGLDLNVARYNIGGGNASDVPDYLRQGAAVEGWWKDDADGTAGVPTTYAERDAYLKAWDADDDASYDWDSDATQRWWVEKLAEMRDDMVWEAFSNSPPYFMTKSGYVTGSMNKTDEQLLPTDDAPQKFVTYLTKVTEHLEDTYGIEFSTVDPFNEPCNGYWGTPALGADGWPKTGGTVQEGAQICPGTGANDQQNVINLLSATLAGSSTDAMISANDETNPGQFVNAWNQYDAQTRAAVGQLNVHTYGTGNRLQARDIAKTNDKPLWMSEVGGDFVGTGFNTTTITGGLGMAQRITDDLRELEPNAWVFWQEVEDYYNMEKVENLNWGSIFIDFDCNEPGTVGYSERRLADAGWTSGEPLPDSAKCQIVTNSKFNTARNYTQHIRPGDHVIPTNSTQSTAAVTADGTGANIVHINDSTAARSVTLDLSKFGEIAADATVTPVVTTEVTDPEHPEKNALVEGAPVTIAPGATSVTIEIPARSVTTFVVDGVSGVAEGSLPVQDGETFQLVGVGSGRALTAGATGASITDLATTTSAVGSQLWTAHALPQGSGSHALRYVLEAADGRVLGATSSGVALKSQSVADALTDPSSWWALSTTDGSTWSFASGSRSLALEVGGQATANNSGVSLWQYGGGAHQRWTVRDTSIVSVPDVAVSTVAGVEPTLPGSVVPVYSYGNGVAAPVTWQLPAASTWDVPGSVTVTGTGTDVFGSAFEVRAIVDVGGFTSTDPVSVTTYAGASLASVQASAPATVPAQVGASAQRFDTPVVWDWAGLDDASFAAEGVVTVPGTAESNDPAGDPVPATLSVILTAPTLANVTPQVSSAVASSFESGYPIDRTYNLATGDKGWSNWVGSNKPTTSTLQYSFAAPQDVETVSTYFFKDGGSTTWAQTMTVDYLNTDGTWSRVPEPALTVEAPADGTAPKVDVDLGGVRTTSVRLTLNAFANTHMIVSEVEIYATTASVSTVADLGALRVDGSAVDGFSPDVEAYTVTTAGARYPQVSAVPVDSAATVTVDQPTEATDGLATVTVTAPDGTTTRSYIVDVDRQVSVSAVAVAGDPTVGATVTATSVTDPADATVSYRWLVDGTEVTPGTDGATLSLADVAVGASVTVAATAERDGFAVSEEVLSAPVVVRAVVPDPEPEPEPTGPEPTPGPTDPEPSPTGPAPTEPAPTSPTLPGADVPFSVTLSSASVRAGGTLTVDVAGATRDGSVEVWLHSTPVRLAVVQADTSGAASRTVTIPAATETGTHRIQVVDTTTGASVWSGELTVTPAATGSGLASTGAEVTSLAVVALLLLGAGTLAVRRRRLAQD